jgi:alkylation response protein AidB-like acyl-CoA dehydrogenase
MSAETSRRITEEQSRQVAEASRQKEWEHPSLLREMFLGNFRLDLLHPYPLVTEERAEFQAFYESFEQLMRGVDSLAIEQSGEYPPKLVDALRKLGAFGMKIPQEYGGLGFTNREYQKVMQLVGSVDGSISALLSAHQSIGVPQPLKLFGSKELKEKYLPRCARGEISAFALTELDVGSDPARLETTARKLEDGSYRLNGTKLWCTNGTIADLLVVMAKDPDNNKISAFVVEMAWPGVKIERRCHFMGLKALANGIISFTDVEVPAENLIGQEGRGLKIALTTLNDGRLSIPNGSIGTAKICVEICRKWGSERVQWGKPVAYHEAIAHKIADMAATTFAMESMVGLATAMADQGGVDIRLEAAAAKEWISTHTWHIIDETMQVRGGRGYETEASLRDRGEQPIGVERMMRDYRINTIFEGSSEIMHLIMAREAVDKHLEVAGDLINPKASAGKMAAALVRSALYYLWWYPTRWLGWGRWPRYAAFGRLARHLRFVERMTRKLAREVFHGMTVHRAKMERKQAFLFRLVDVANELFAIAASASRAEAMRSTGLPEAAAAADLADLACRNSRRQVRRLFRDLWHNDDAYKYRQGVSTAKGAHAWLEEGSLGLREWPEVAAPVVVQLETEPATPATVS